MPLLPSGINVDAIAEERIQEAIRRGELDNLPGAGKPLAFDDDLLVPVELRVANRILKNAGMVPLEIETRREIATLESEIPAIEDSAERARALQKLAILRVRLGGRRGGTLASNDYYARKIIEKLGGA